VLLFHCLGLNGLVTLNCRRRDEINWNMLYDIWLCVGEGAIAS